MSELDKVMNSHMESWVLLVESRIITVTGMSFWNFALIIELMVGNIWFIHKKTHQKTFEDEG